MSHSEIATINAMIGLILGAVWVWLIQWWWNVHFWPIGNAIPKKRHYIGAVTAWCVLAVLGSIITAVVTSAALA